MLLIYFLSVILAFVLMMVTNRLRSSIYNDYFATDLRIAILIMWISPLLIIFMSYAIFDYYWFEKRYKNKCLIKFKCYFEGNPEPKCEK
jgi:type III secretory pathway component EscU